MIMAGVDNVDPANFVLPAAPVILRRECARAKLSPRRFKTNSKASFRGELSSTRDVCMIRLTPSNVTRTGYAY